MIEEGLADLKFARHQRSQDGRGRKHLLLPRDGSWVYRRCGVGADSLPISELSQRGRRVTLSQSKIGAVYWLFGEPLHIPIFSLLICRY